VILRLIVIPKFWTVNFQGRFSQIMVFCFIYILVLHFFEFFVFSFLQSTFFCSMKFKLVTNLVLNWVCPILYFLERFQPIMIATMCIVVINVLEPSAFNVESLYFIWLFNRISWLCGQHPREDETSNGGCNSSPTRHDFQDNFNFYFLFVTMKIKPFSKCENRSSSQIGY